jgi:cytochrome c-type biogenesis protein CcmF
MTALGMLPELGQFALVLAFVVAIVQSTLPMIGAHRGIGAWMDVARPAAYAQLACIGIAFAALTVAFVTQDFSVKYVASNSKSLLPLPYRYSAVWGSHEGSLLLWALVLALWTAAVATFSRTLPRHVVARVLSVMGIVAVGFLAFLIFTSDPFARLLPAAAEGRDLNPLLQDPGLIVHPPMLYTGYVGFAVPFAFAIAALLEGGFDSRWLRWTRPWTNVAWACLTIGIALGSWWAYYELGWGGWWFWDPVENASFMPWLAGAARIHSQAVKEKRGGFVGWTLLLAIAAFSLSLLGTFLVRSGVLTSVHAFAADPTRGTFVLIFLGIIVGGSLLLYALRAPDGAAAKGAYFASYSRETLLLVNNVLLTASCAMVLLGTLYPLLADALELGKISVGPPYFASFFIPLVGLLALLLPLGPLTKWQRDDASRPAKLLAPLLVLSLLVGVATFLLLPQGGWKTALGAAGAAWVVLGTLRFVVQRLRMPGARFTAEMVGMVLAHTGVGVFVVGALLVEGMAQQHELALRPGQSVDVAGYSFRFDGVAHSRGPNYEADRGTVVVSRGDRVVETMHPEKRNYASGGQVMTEAAIVPGVAKDLYVALGESLGGGAWAVRVHVKPFVRWIWGGALLMALGGLVAASDRRFRSVRRTAVGMPADAAAGVAR